MVASMVVSGSALASPQCLRPDDAATHLRQVAFEDPSPQAALAAAKEYLEALNAIATKQSRPECFDDMERDVPKLREKLCGPTAADRDGETCVLLATVASDIERLHAQRLVEQADRLGGDAAQPLFAKAGAAYVDIFRAHCEEPSFEQRPLHGTVAGCTEIVFNAARAFYAAHLSSKAIVTHRMLLTFDERMKAHSPLAVRSLRELGALYQGLVLYEQAAEYYERYATSSPASPHADEALRDAVILRLGLGDEAQATKDAATFAKTYGATKRAETAELAVALASHHAEHENWARAATVITSSLSMIDRAPLDITIRAHLLLAHAHSKSGTRERAAAEYANIRAMWRDPSGAAQAIRRGWPGEDESQQTRRLARSLVAVGEAMFVAAETRRLAEVATLKFPVYQGPDDRAAVLAHLQTQVRPWFEKKRAAIALVEADYLRILELQPAPPPAWVIAAGAAVGTMWSDLVADFGRVPIPGAWRKVPALYHAYWDAVDDMSESIRARFAKPAMKKCVELGAKFQLRDEHARACEVWLAKNYKSEFHVVDELIPEFRATDLRALLHASPSREPLTPPDR